MKQVLLFLLLAFGITYKASAQFGVSYYQSDLSFASFHYTFAERLTAELRLSTSTFLYDLSPEIVATYQFIHKPTHAVYAGAGGRFNLYPGIVFPLGLQVSPFEKLRNFAFSTELAIIGVVEGDAVLRGALGIRYYFVKPE
uniref:Uncharacterized protein n=1 Tax=Roseihalotalea indica TaxID=2867963 RepID=A0AA49JH39_9BACT|nr:hypothetical protein K4G66_02600 [Tunicatimonas sp. TK19036]